MRFHADLHVHSKYSRATSRDLDLEHLAWWAARKGIAVVATGDCVHPQWLAELKEKLVPAEPGVFRLRPEIEAAVFATLPPSCQATPRFLLSTEISTIYKKGDKTRKIHHLIYAPDFSSVDRLAAKLGSIGNIASDGRPILGLDSRNLLEIALESGPHSYLVPAHIWTPWFAALGSQSGFDSIEACYGDLSGNIFAVETGLSSDPAMNWRISFLDRYRLTSNSDAHSPGKLGREATLFDCAPDYFSIRAALETGAGYVGTVEFFPEEGKYHADGHRKCGVRLSPKETLELNGRCPVCGGALTIGVLHRVETLADRSEDEAVPPPTAGEVKSLVPLPEILGEIFGVGPSSKRVAQAYDRTLARLGPELAILEELPLEEISSAGSPLLSEAVARLRAGNVVREAGCDGEYGVIRLFREGELSTLRGGDMLFDAPPAKRLPPLLRGRAGEGGRPQTQSAAGLQASTPSSERAVVRAPGRDDPSREGRGDTSILAALDPDQRAAASYMDGPLLVIAGPGSGKTRVLTHRIAHLVAARGVAAEGCLAITFTRRAAEEMRERLAALLPPEAARAVPVHTFHSLGLAILRQSPKAAHLMPGFRIAGEAERIAVLAAALDVPERKAATLVRRISKAKRGGVDAIDAGLADAVAAYSTLLAARNWVDFDDLVGLAGDVLQRDAALAKELRTRFQAVSVDELQDVDEAQYRLLRLITPDGERLCAIGDPDQAIYGFRGADASSFERFQRDYPTARSVSLKRNYRSSGTIVAAASQIIARGRKEPPLAEIVREMHDKIAIHVAPSERAEAEFVVATVEKLLGGHSFFSIDSGRTENSGSRDLSFADIAVLYRTEAQSAALAEALTRSGMPFKKSGNAPLMQNAAVRALLAGIEAAPSELPLSEALQQAAARLGVDVDATTLGSVTSPSRGGRNSLSAAMADFGRGADPSAPLPPPENGGASLAVFDLPSRGRLRADGAGDPQGDSAAETIDAAALTEARGWLSELATRCGEDRVRLLEAAALASEADFFDPRADRIALLTMHAGKGLEFPVVFVTGLEEGIVPLSFGARDAESEKEERRLFYVAVTRAKDLLFLTRAEQRMWRGKPRRLAASPFLSDIEAALLRLEAHALPRRRPELAQLTLF